MKLMRQFLKSFWRSPDERPAFEALMINQGRILAKMNEGKDYSILSDVEFKVFSQWGEDGIIQYLVSKIPDINKTFIEFGVEDFSESNCRFLMMKDRWSGAVIDGSTENIKKIKKQNYYWHFNINAICRFITKENIREILESTGLGYNCGILSVDIDGVDYHVLEELEDWTPSILIVEYNALFGPYAAVSVPYEAAFVRHNKHYSGLYWGASLAAFNYLAESRGYALVGVNSTGSNAFFVRRDQLWCESAILTVAEAYRPVGFREARDESGELSFLNEIERLKLIGDMPLIDVISGETVTVTGARGIG